MVRSNILRQRCTAKSTYERLIFLLLPIFQFLVLHGIWHLLLFSVNSRGYSDPTIIWNIRSYFFLFLISPHIFLTSNLLFSSIICFVSTLLSSILSSHLTVTIPYYTLPSFPPSLTSNAHGVASDYWSLGVLAFELLFGQRPFERHCPAQHISYLEECLKRTALKKIFAESVKVKFRKTNQESSQILFLQWCAVRKLLSHKFST